MANAVALIPARAGSKGVPGKNIRRLAGVPLIAWSILAAKGCSSISRVVVSTDSREIADVALSFGAEVPFLRPAELAGDTSPDRAYTDHALDFFKSEGREPDLIVLLRPTTPLREPEQLDAAVGLIAGSRDATSLRSVHALPEPPQKMMGIDNGWLIGLFPHDTRPEYYNLPRQSFPTAYQPNGYVDILTRAWLRSNPAGIFGPRVLAFVTAPAVEVDTPEAFELLEFQIARRKPRLIEQVAARQT
jgi:CMP-N-acetylneuraminic acid synthetase